ncbi:DUF1002 domain-containing protein [Neobacillus piezotolerans]|uniref:DUF1002 domain-containing protein n=1 Tax=Neobacillus piezotolerans TaxID=2259171 RepID=A0A3D8GKS4_9BACI|nr:DUF1002 domain-containing protein [Neobacillus piezotolerans]RDU35008.1 DUF1002 domain-containing protein [Neobacillus piezotolerans]
MKKFLCCFAAAFVFTMPFAVSADLAEGDMIVTLGENLSEAQKEALLKEMGAPSGVEVITVSNEEEHQYLGKYVPKTMIGTRAISSSATTVNKKDTGLTVKTKNITWVTDEMYLNALMTAGVKDASIYITAPVAVSGTAALTGIIKAYEISANETIPENIKQAANEEMVETAKLGDSIGKENASALIAKVKEEIAKDKPKDEAELKALIEEQAKELKVELSSEELNSLTALFKKLQDLNIDWGQVGDQLDKAKDQFTKFLDSEEGHGILASLKKFFKSIADVIRSFFE